MANNALTTTLALGIGFTIATANQGQLNVITAPSSAGGVTSVFGRGGDVVAQNGDYSSGQVTNTSAVGGATVSDALNTLRSVGGQLSGTLPNPNVVGISETSGPTNLAIGAIADGQALVRSGATITGVTPIAAPANPGDDGKIPRAIGGTFVYVAGTTNDVWQYNGTSWVSANIVNANINSAAGINGTKTDGIFGALTVTTTGKLQSNSAATPILELGSTAAGAGHFATVGVIRGNNVFNISARDTADANNVSVLDYNVLTVNTIQLGENSSRVNTIFYFASALHGWRIGVNTVFQVKSTGVVVAGSMAFDAAASTPNVIQNPSSSDGVKTNMLVQAQAFSGTGTGTSGDLQLFGGDCTASGAVTSQTAGNVVMRGGISSGSSGTRVNGFVSITTPGGTQLMKLDSTGIGVFAHATSAQRTLTDNSTGVAANQLVDVGAAFNQANINNNFASIRAALAAYGWVN